MEETPAAAAAEGVKKIQIYSSSSSSSGRQVTPFWRERYERDAKKYWDIFYKRHKDKFFKDRHYLDKEWGDYFQAREGEKLVVLEVGCGAGNTIFPLVTTYPEIIVHACDFSPRAIDLVKAHKGFGSDQINAFVCDLTTNNLNDAIQPSSVDIVLMVFVLSAVSPEKMPLVLQNIKKVLKPNGHVLLRDYASGDLAQERLTSKEQEISENFYVRGDGTRAYYFSSDFLNDLFTQNGFDAEKVDICDKKVENRSLELVMNRRWIQAVFSLNVSGTQRSMGIVGHNINERNDHVLIEESLKGLSDSTEIDFSQSIAEIFGVSTSFDEVIEIKVRGYSFVIKALAKEYQHTCKSTGLLLWVSAHLMCNVLAENPSIVAGKRVLELGCGSSGICSMVAAPFADLVVATDGDAEALDLLRQNIATNIKPGSIEKLVIRHLIWGNKEDIKAVEDLVGGFDVIIGTDVTYNPDAVSPLFETARELILDQDDAETKPSLVLCYLQRRVHEDTIISTALQYGFRLVDRWVNGMPHNDGIMSAWFSKCTDYLNEFKNTPLTILYFQI